MAKTRRTAKRKPPGAGGLTIERVPVSKINPAPYNPRKDLQPGDPEYKKLKRSIGEFGYVDPLVWNKRSGTLVGGHQRLKVLVNEHDVTYVDVSVVDLDPAAEKALNLALNKIAGAWDDPALASLLAELQEGGEDATLTGFDQAEIDDLLASAQPDPVQDEVPDVPEEAVTQCGDLWTLGEHRVLCGDSTKPLPFDVPMFLFTDPPYGINYKAMRGGKPIAGDEHQAGAEKITAAALAVGQFSSGFVCCNWRTLGGVSRILEEAGLAPKACIVWDKACGVQNLDRYHKQHEMLVYFGPYGGEATKCGDVWTIPRDFDPDHVTPKPVELAAKAIETAEMDSVYDPFLGSGTTLIAAEQLSRKCYGIEIEPRYVDVTLKRWMNLTGKSPVRESDGASVVITDCGLRIAD